MSSTNGIDSVIAILSWCRRSAIEFGTAQACFRLPSTRSEPPTDSRLPRSFRSCRRTSHSWEAGVTIERNDHSAWDQTRLRIDSIRRYPEVRVDTLAKNVTDRIKGVRTECRCVKLRIACFQGNYWWAMDVAREGIFGKQAVFALSTCWNDGSCHAVTT